MRELGFNSLLVVRHGEGEGDVRRSAAKAGKFYEPKKSIQSEELTTRGVEQAEITGRWIAKFILKANNWKKFDRYFVSPSIRSQQTAKAMFPKADWKIDEKLMERNRGIISGISSEKHAEVYPGSYQSMISEPLTWVPPDGESIMQVAQRAEDFISTLGKDQNIIAVTHRDWIWALHSPLDGLNFDKLANLDTESINNCQAIYYSKDSELRNDTAPIRFKKSAVCPWVSSGTIYEQDIYLNNYI